MGMWAVLWVYGAGGEIGAIPSWSHAAVHTGIQQQLCASV